MRSLSYNERAALRELFFEGAASHLDVRATPGVVDELRELGLVAGTLARLTITPRGEALCLEALKARLPRYQMVRDNDSHRYLIPSDRHAEWGEWLCIPSRDPASWDVPEFARSIDGGALSFTQPMINDEPLEPAQP